MQEQKGKRRQISFVESSPKDQLQPKLHTFTYAKPGDRKISMVFQRNALFDSLSVWENVAFRPIHNHGMGRGEARGRLARDAKHFANAQRAVAVDGQGVVDDDDGAGVGRRNRVDDLQRINRIGRYGNQIPGPHGGADFGRRPSAPGFEGALDVAPGGRCFDGAAGGDNTTLYIWTSTETTPALNWAVAMS